MTQKQGENGNTDREDGREGGRGSWGGGQRECGVRRRGREKGEEVGVCMCACVTSI